MILDVSDSSQVATARRAAGELSRRGGFSEENAGRAALIATEMATNLLKHAGRGEIALQAFSDAEGVGVELMALDKGPGIRDMALAFADGNSTAGSAGTGLGAIRRQADRFGIFSRPGLGTAILARVCGPEKAPAMNGILLGTMVRPYPGETHCGDSWAFGTAPQGPTLLTVDGSGHGHLAEIAAQMAVASFRANLDADCPRLAERIHHALAPTRGAAIAVARVDQAQRMVRFVGVGNISAATISNGTVRRMVSHNGTAGQIAPRIREFTYPYHAAPTILLHSDGVSPRWELDSYPGLTASHPSLIAGILYRDYRRERDDAAVIIMRAAS